MTTEDTDSGNISCESDMLGGYLTLDTTELPDKQVGATEPETPLHHISTSNLLQVLTDYDTDTNTGSYILKRTR